MTTKKLSRRNYKHTKGKSRKSQQRNRTYLQRNQRCKKETNGNDRTALAYKVLVFFRLISVGCAFKIWTFLPSVLDLTFHLPALVYSQWFRESCQHLPWSIREHESIEFFSGQSIQFRVRHMTKSQRKFVVVVVVFWKYWRKQPFFILIFPSVKI